MPEVRFLSGTPQPRQKARFFIVSMCQPPFNHFCAYAMHIPSMCQLPFHRLCAYAMHIPSMCQLPFHRFCAYAMHIPSMCQLPFHHFYAYAMHIPRAAPRAPALAGGFYYARSDSYKAGRSAKQPPGVHRSTAGCTSARLTFTKNVKKNLFPAFIDLFLITQF